MRVGKDLRKSLVQPSAQRLGLDILLALPRSCKGRRRRSRLSQLAGISLNTINLEQTKQKAP